MTPVQEPQPEASIACPTETPASEAIRLGLFVGLGLAALGFGWWLSVPVPIQELDGGAANLIHGIYSALGMAVVWILLTDLDAWSSKFRRAATIAVSTLLLAWVATNRGIENWADPNAHAAAMLVELRTVLISTTHNPWWVLILSQVLLVTSLWICVLPFWIRHRWPRRFAAARQPWLPTLIVGGGGLALVATIFAWCSHFYRYPYYGPTAPTELSDYNRIAAVFAGFFPVPLLWLTGGRWWKIGRYFALLAVLLGLGMWEANAEWIGQRLDYQQKLAYTRLLRFSLGLWFVYLWLGGWLVIGQLGLLSSRPTARPACRLLATWLLLLLLAISLPRYLEPISLLQSAGDWPTARRHARILGETRNLSSHRRVAEAAKQCRVFRHFPRAISVNSPWQASRIWRLIVDLDTALQPDFLDQLDELAATDFLIILAVDVDPDTLTEQQTEQLLDLQFRIIRK